MSLQCKGGGAAHNPETIMFSFTLPNGRIIEKPKAFCVAVKCNGRWSTKFYGTLKGADNEIKFLRNSSKGTKTYYGIESYQMIKGVPA